MIPAKLELNRHPFASLQQPNTIGHTMQIKNGLSCRYCGKSWYPHSLQPHEKSCRQKILIILDELRKRRIISAPPKIPEYTEEILPNLKQTDQIRLYNAWAMGVFESVKLTCDYCGRKISPHAYNEHQAECAISHPVQEFHQPTRRTTLQDVKGVPLAGTKKTFKGPKYFGGNLNTAGDPGAVPEWMRKEIEMRNKYNEEQKSREQNSPAEMYEEEEDYAPPKRSSGGVKPPASMGSSKIPRPGEAKPWQTKRPKPSSKQGSSGNGEGSADGFGIQPNTYVPPKATTSRPRTTGTGGGASASAQRIRSSGGGSSPNVQDGPVGKGGGDFNRLLSMAEGETGGPDSRIACSNCGRKFAADRIAKHEAICFKSKSGPVAVVKAHSNNLACAASEEARELLEECSKVDPKKEMKLKRIAEIKANERRLFKDKKLSASANAMRSGGGGGGGRMGGGLMSLQSAEPRDGREACRYCGRKFNPDRITKHEEICSRVENKPDKVERKLPTGIGLKKVGFSPQGKEIKRTTVPRSTPSSSSARVSASSSGYGVQRTSAQPAAIGKRTINANVAAVKFCQNCGGSLAGSPRFCSSCGFPLK